MTDWFWYKGKAHPIRSSPDYDQALVGLSEHDKNYLRGGTRSYTTTSYGRTERVALHAADTEDDAVRLAHNTLTYYQKQDLEEARFKPKYRRQIY